MTITTEREIVSPQNGRVPKLDSPAVSTRARARIPVTQSEIKLGDRISRQVAGWWALTCRPLSLRALWRASAVDRKRIPNGDGVLRAVWRLSNHTDRYLILALIFVAPTFVTGPLRWLATRPTRRWGFYLTVIVLTAAYLIGRK